jgi:hypothetical protein
MPITLTIESYQEFAARHGADPVNLGAYDENHEFVIGQWIGFSDGARVLSSDNSARQEPPPVGTWGNVVYRREYWQSRLAQATERADRYSTDCQQLDALAQRYVNFSGVDASHIEGMKVLSNEVVFSKTKLADIESELAQQPEEQAKRRAQQAREESDLARRSASSALLRQLREARV